VKIDNSFKAVTTGPVPDETERPGRTVKSGVTFAPPGANVQLSPQTSHMQAIEHGFADTPVVNSARVAELKLAISNGHFKVDAGKVADRLLSTVQELILAHKA
jgi:negative regulator of flagellin synthesis FlgM